VGDDKGGRPAKGDKNADIVSAVSDGDKRKNERLRAILRAPEPIQDLYRQGLVSQTVAAKAGPRKPDEEQDLDSVTHTIDADHVIRPEPLPAATDRPRDRATAKA
jgi:hypothetical protein